MNQYNYKVNWSDYDEGYVARCVEFPTLTCLDDTPELALQGIREIVTEVVDSLVLNNKSVPKPITAKQYSGKFVVRISPKNHEQLVFEAQSRGISLNQLVMERLN